MDGWPGHRSPRPPPGAVRIRPARETCRIPELLSSPGGGRLGGTAGRRAIEIVLFESQERYRGRLYSAAKNSCWAVEYGRALGEVVDHDGRGSSARRGGSWLLPLRLVERAREDVVGDPVEVIGDACPVPGLVGPERAERVERPAAEQRPVRRDVCSAVTAAMPACPARAGQRSRRPRRSRGRGSCSW